MIYSSMDLARTEKYDVVIIRFKLFYLQRENCFARVSHSGTIFKFNASANVIFYSVLGLNTRFYLLNPLEYTKNIGSCNIALRGLASNTFFFNRNYCN